MVHKINIYAIKPHTGKFKVSVRIAEDSIIFSELEKYFGWKQRLSYSADRQNETVEANELIFNLDPGKLPSVAQVTNETGKTRTPFISLNTWITSSSKLDKKLPFHPDETKVFIKDDKLHIPLTNQQEINQQSIQPAEERHIEADIKRLPDLIMSKIVQDETFTTKVANTVLFKLQPQLKDLQQSQDDALQEFANKLINYWEGPVNIEQKSQSPQ